MSSDRYYLVDSGYPNRKGFLAPYRNTRYHIPEFQNVGPRGRNEIFNSLHSFLRNVIERAFGVLKKRWALLQKFSNFSFPDQVKIVIAAIALHNFIIEQRLTDEVTTRAGCGWCASVPRSIPSRSPGGRRAVPRSRATW